jgi:hypothetical protein
VSSERDYQSRGASVDARIYSDDRIAIPFGIAGANDRINPQNPTGGITNALRNVRSTWSGLRRRCHPPRLCNRI